ncbi:MAG: hypothetical protein AB7P69_20940 [Candidatus Binatia bacterium]
MAEDSGASATPEANVVTAPLKPPVPYPPPLDVLTGTDTILDGDSHIGVAVLVTSDGKPSTLMIPDASKVKDGKPVYITKPIRIKGDKLKPFLEKKLGKGKIPDNVMSLIADTSISCEAFYYTKDGPLLIMFALQFNDGLITTLTGDPELGELFDIQGASVRLFRCPEKSYSVLQNYAAELTK